jgi:hypothetical protein
LRSGCRQAGRSSFFARRRTVIAHGRAITASISARVNLVVRPAQNHGSLFSLAPRVLLAAHGRAGPASARDAAAWPAATFSFGALL